MRYRLARAGELLLAILFLPFKQVILWNLLILKKLISILIAIIVLFNIGVKNKPTGSLNKSLHLWYICGIAVFIVIELVTCIIVGNVEAVNIMNYISFAATLASLILSVLAIFMTVLSGESMNKLRDSMMGLKDVPSKVETALKSTIEGMGQSTKELKLATKENNETTKKLNDLINTKIEEIEKHILSKLELHQKAMLKTIDDKIITNNNTTVDSHKLSPEIIKTFLSGTSNASISLLYIINKYCEKVMEFKGKQPVVKLAELAYAINGGKNDDRFGMYLFACLVILSSFGLLDYEIIEDQSSDVKFNSVDPTVVSNLPTQVKSRGLNVALEDLNQYIDSLFNDNTKEGYDDGSEIDKD